MHPDAKPLDPDAVLAALDRYGVRAVIIGSLAAAMQGVDLPLTDIDLVPELSESNVRALAAALRELGIDGERGVSPTVVAFMDQMPGFIRSSDVWTVLTERGEVDITPRPDGFPVRGTRRAGLVLMPTVDRRTGRQVMRWMRP